MSARTAGLLAVAFLAAAAVAAQEPPAPRSAENAWTSSPPVREEMASLEVRLEQAVARVSMPHAGILLGRSSSSRGYRLPGYGVVFVLTPRALPGDRAVFVFRPGHEHPGAAVRVERHVTRDVSGGELERIEELERQVLVLQHTAEAHRRAAEEDMDRLVHDIRVRVEVPEAAEETPMIIAETPDVTAVPDTEAAPPPDAFFVAEADEDGPPPWRYWFEAKTGQEKRSPDRVVRDVKTALLDELESRGETVPSLAPDEFVTVAIDFVPGGVFASHERPTRTLIVRVRQRDLAARSRGDLASEDLRSRVEVIEY